MASHTVLAKHAALHHHTIWHSGHQCNYYGVELDLGGELAKAMYVEFRCLLVRPDLIHQGTQAEGKGNC